MWSYPTEFIYRERILNIYFLVSVPYRLFFAISEPLKSVDRRVQCTWYLPIGVFRYLTMGKGRSGRPKALLLCSTIKSRICGFHSHLVQTKRLAPQQDGKKWSFNCSTGNLQRKAIKNIFGATNRFDIARTETSFLLRLFVTFMPLNRKWICQNWRSQYLDRCTIYLNFLPQTSTKYVQLRPRNSRHIFERGLVQSRKNLFDKNIYSNIHSSFNQR